MGGERLLQEGTEDSKLLLMQFSINQLSLEIQSRGSDSSYELPHDKTSKMACTTSEDSDQPGHLPSLIRVFAVPMKKIWVPLRALRRF